MRRRARWTSKRCRRCSIAGWAPLTGIIAERDKFIDLPIPEPNQFPARSGRADESRRPFAGARAAGRPARIRRHGARRARARRSGVAGAICARSYVAGSAPAKTHYTEADDPKRLVDIAEAIHRGVDLYGARRFDEAIAAYRQVLARRPDMALVYKHLAFVEWERGNLAGAIAVLQQAIRGGVVRRSPGKHMRHFRTPVGPVHRWQTPTPDTAQAQTRH